MEIEIEIEIGEFDLKRHSKSAHLHRITRHRRIIAEKNSIALQKRRPASIAMSRKRRTD